MESYSSLNLKISTKIILYSIKSNGLMMLDKINCTKIAFESTIENFCSNKNFINFVCTFSHLALQQVNKFAISSLDFHFQEMNENDNNPYDFATNALAEVATKLGADASADTIITVPDQLNATEDDLSKMLNP